MPGHQQSGRRQPAVLGQPVGEGFGWYWPTEEVPLADITAECLQLGPDGLGLDPFGHHRDAELAVSYTHLRAHETRHDLVCRLLLEKKKKQHNEEATPLSTKS